MNEVNILLADNEKFKFITAIFSPYTGTNTYTYKTLLDVEVEDFVVVQTPSNGFQVVQIREVLSPFEVDLEVKFEYKWVVQKIDTTHYEQVASMEKEAILEHTDTEVVTKLVRL